MTAIIPILRADTRFPAGPALVLLLSLSLPTTPVAAQPGRLDRRIQERVDHHEAAIVEIRHRIHQHPELGNREFETARLVAERLRELGYEVRTGVAHTGVVARLEVALHSESLHDWRVEPVTVSAGGREPTSEVRDGPD